MFGDRLKELRKNNNISQEKLGELLGVSSNAIYSWEISRTQPSLETINKLAEYFGVTTDYLLGVDYNKLEKLKSALKENNLMAGDDLTIEELRKALSIVEMMKDFAFTKFINSNSNTVKNDFIILHLPLLRIYH